MAKLTFLATVHETSELLICFVETEIYKRIIYEQKALIWNTVVFF